MCFTNGLCVWNGQKPTSLCWYWLEASLSSENESQWRLGSCVCVCVCVWGEVASVTATVRWYLVRTACHTHISGTLLVVGKSVAGHGVVSVNEKTTWKSSWGAVLVVCLMCLTSWNIAVTICSALFNTPQKNRIFITKCRSGLHKSQEPCRQSNSVL